MARKLFWVCSKQCLMILVLAKKTRAKGDQRVKWVLLEMLQERRNCDVVHLLWLCNLSPEQVSFYVMISRGDPAFVSTCWHRTHDLYTIFIAYMKCNVTVFYEGIVSVYNVLPRFLFMHLLWSMQKELFRKVLSNADFHHVFSQQPSTPPGEIISLNQSDYFYNH